MEWMDENGILIVIDARVQKCKQSVNSWCYEVIGYKILITTPATSPTFRDSQSTLNHH